MNRHYPAREMNSEEREQGATSVGTLAPDDLARQTQTATPWSRRPFGEGPAGEREGVGAAGTHDLLGGAPADLRKGFDGLSGLVSQRLGQDLLSGDCYLFVNAVNGRPSRATRGRPYGASVAA